jgi:hypothetical protein
MPTAPQLSSLHPLGCEPCRYGADEELRKVRHDDTLFFYEVEQGVCNVVVRASPRVKPRAVLNERLLTF